MQFRELVSRFSSACALGALFVAGSPASADPIGLDGTIGAEWSGVTPSHVLFDSAAPSSNFDSPSNKSNNVAYDIYMRTDAHYLYAGLKTTGPAVDNSLVFANLYFALVYGGGTGLSTIGFQVTNDLAFDTSNGTAFSDSPANLIRSAVFTGTDTDPDVIEVAIDLSVFMSNALGVSHFSGLPSGETADGIAMFMSQSFGYSAAGGTTDYGPAHLGFVATPNETTVPEPGSLALAGLALAGLAAAGALGRRRGSTQQR